MKGFFQNIQNKNELNEIKELEERTKFSRSKYTFSFVVRKLLTPNKLEAIFSSDCGTYDNVRKIATDQGDNYTARCLLDYVYFENYYKMIAIDLSKQQALDADLKAVQQVNFTGNLDQAGNTTMFFIIEEEKGTIVIVL